MAAGRAGPARAGRACCRWPSSCCACSTPAPSPSTTSSPRTGPTSSTRSRSCVDHPGSTASRGADDVTAACEQLIAGWYGNQPLDLVRRARGGRRAGRDPADHHGAAAGRHHVRRPRLEHRLDEQPAAVRAPPRAGLARQGLAVGLLAGVARTRRPGGVLDRHVGRRVGRATCRSPTTPCRRRTSRRCWAPASPRGAAVFGYALTMLLRSTVGTLGLLFAVGVLLRGDRGRRARPRRRRRAVHAVGQLLRLRRRRLRATTTTTRASSATTACDCGGEHTVCRSASVIYFAVIWSWSPCRRSSSFRAPRRALRLSRTARV